MIVQLFTLMPSTINLYLTLKHTKYNDPIKGYLNSSYFFLPNIQTSLAVVNLLKLIDSGAIHLIGSLPFEAENKYTQ